MLMCPHLSNRRRKNKEKVENLVRLISLRYVIVPSATLSTTPVFFGETISAVTRFFIGVPGFFTSVTDFFGLSICNQIHDVAHMKLVKGNIPVIFGSFHS